MAVPLEGMPVSQPAPSTECRQEEMPPRRNDADDMTGKVSSPEEQHFSKKASVPLSSGQE
jgi:hypothetical protein